MRGIDQHPGAVTLSHKLSMNIGIAYSNRVGSCVRDGGMISKCS